MGWGPKAEKVESINSIGDVVLVTEGQLGRIEAHVQATGLQRLSDYDRPRIELWQDSTQVMADFVDVDRIVRRVPAGSYMLKGMMRGYGPVTLPLEVAAGRSTQVQVAMEDLGTRFYVDAGATAGGDGTKERPFRTIQEGLSQTSVGDTVQLAAGTYSQPLELVSGVTILGAGADQTRIVGKANWDLAARPFIVRQFVGEGNEFFFRMILRDVVLQGFTLDGGRDYPQRSAEEVADLLALAMAIDRQDVGAVKEMLGRDPGLATARFYPADTGANGSAVLHRVGRDYVSASDAECEIAELLIEHGADINSFDGQGDGQGRSALERAAYYGNPRLVELYLAHGAEASENIMAVAAYKGWHARKKTDYIPVFEALVRAGVSIWATWSCCAIPNASRPH